MPNPWALRLALLFALYATFLIVYILISPLPIIQLFGLDLYASASLALSPLVLFITVFGGRNLAIGLAMLAFYW